MANLALAAAEAYGATASAISPLDGYAYALLHGSTLPPPSQLWSALSLAQSPATPSTTLMFLCPPTAAAISRALASRTDVRAELRVVLYLGERDLHDLAAHEKAVSVGGVSGVIAQRRRSYVVSCLTQALALLASHGAFNVVVAAECDPPQLDFLPPSVSTVRLRDITEAPQTHTHFVIESDVFAGRGPCGAELDALLRDGGRVTFVETYTTVPSLYWNASDAPLADAVIANAAHVHSELACLPMLSSPAFKAFCNSWCVHATTEQRLDPAQASAVVRDFLRRLAAPAAAAGKLQQYLEGVVGRLQAAVVRPSLSLSSAATISEMLNGATADSEWNAAYASLCAEPDSSSQGNVASLLVSTHRVSRAVIAWTHLCAPATFVTLLRDMMCSATSALHAGLQLEELVAWAVLSHAAPVDMTAQM